MSGPAVACSHWRSWAKPHLSPRKRNFYAHGKECEERAAIAAFGFESAVTNVGLDASKERVVGTYLREGQMVTERLAMLKDGWEFTLAL